MTGLGNSDYPCLGLPAVNNPPVFALNNKRPPKMTFCDASRTITKPYIFYKRFKIGFILKVETHIKYYTIKVLRSDLYLNP